MKRPVPTICRVCNSRLCRLVEAPVIQPGKGMQLLEKRAA